MSGNNRTSGAAESNGREIVITRLFDAPPEVVFEAWTNPEQLAQWWGPEGFTNPVCELEVRVGGDWRIVMRAPDGAMYPCRGVYLEIVAPERLVFTNIAVDDEGTPVLDGLTTVTFEGEDGTTKLTLRTSAVALVPGAVEKLAGMDTGWSMSLDRLARELALRKENA
jgi:uncharacterized protein YndB with AHSA1/START domain